MFIGDVSKQFNIPADTLRYYDRIGLLSPGRQRSVRRYSEADLLKLAAIVKMKKLMFSLEEIQIILSADAQIDKSLQQASPDLCAAQALLSQIGAKLREVEALAENIKEVKGELARLAAKVKTVLEAGEHDA
ncbi:MAG: MerR family transcriptional regulator [Eubacteriales bacterium]|nr:MerR family transcriptional regulator [Eubacteriales bacterium]MDD3074522.1 MerR family transcriptional regulator [Eubacteriales bacterium]